MFTGIVTATGTVRDVRTRGNYRSLSITSTLAAEAFELGESVACDGVCLTVVAHDRSGFVVEASPETVRATIVGGYRTGSVINLERAVKGKDRLGGHLVSGHVDDVGRIDYLRPAGESRELAVAFDRRFDRLVVSKGSVALNGLSLTVNAVRSGWLSVNFIPYTLKVTTAGRLRAGDRVNLEFDLVGKYIVKSAGAAARDGMTIEKLRGSGW
jgi:riboflavin synthase